LLKKQVSFFIHLTYNIFVTSHPVGAFTVIWSIPSKSSASSIPGQCLGIIQL
jgi:hypothetical protein